MRKNNHIFQIVLVVLGVLIVCLGLLDYLFFVKESDLGDFAIRIPFWGLAISIIWLPAIILRIKIYPLLIIIVAFALQIYSYQVPLSLQYSYRLIWMWLYGTSLIWLGSTHMMAQKNKG